MAREADETGKAQVWPLCLAHSSDFAIYLQRTACDIPVFICEPA